MYMYLCWECCLINSESQPSQVPSNVRYFHHLLYKEDGEDPEQRLQKSQSREQALTL